MSGHSSLTEEHVVVPYDKRRKRKVKVKKKLNMVLVFKLLSKGKKKKVNCYLTVSNQLYL